MYFLKKTLRQISNKTIQSNNMSNQYHTLQNYSKIAKDMIEKLIYRFFSGSLVPSAVIASVIKHLKDALGKPVKRGLRPKMARIKFSA